MKRILFLFLLPPLMASCGDDDSSPYPNLTAEICDLHTASPKVADGGVTDNGATLRFRAPLPVEWATTADSTYRALLYYNKVSDAETVEPLRADRVLVLLPTPADKAKEWSQSRDPLALGTIWVAKDRRYLNMQISVKSGTAAESTARHTIGLVADTVTTGDGGHRNFHYRLCHSQNGIPAFYSVEAYLSIPLSDLSSRDTLTLTLRTWEDNVTLAYVK